MHMRPCRAVLNASNFSAVCTTSMESSIATRLKEVRLYHSQVTCNNCYTIQMLQSPTVRAA